jgi:hypothetical protein
VRLTITEDDKPCGAHQGPGDVEWPNFAGLSKTGERTVSVLEVCTYSAMKKRGVSLLFTGFTSLWGERVSVPSTTLQVYTGNATFYTRVWGSCRRLFVMSTTEGSSNECRVREEHKYCTALEPEREGYSLSHGFCPMVYINCSDCGGKTIETPYDDRFRDNRGFLHRLHRGRKP